MAKMAAAKTLPTNGQSGRSSQLLILRVLEEMARPQRETSNSLLDALAAWNVYGVEPSAWHPKFAGRGKSWSTRWNSCATTFGVCCSRPRDSRFIRSG